MVFGLDSTSLAPVRAALERWALWCGAFDGRGIEYRERVQSSGAPARDALTDNFDAFSDATRTDARLRALVSALPLGELAVREACKVCGVPIGEAPQCAAFLVGYYSTGANHREGALEALAGAFKVPDGCAYLERCERLFEALAERDGRVDARAMRRIRAQATAAAGDTSAPSLTYRAPELG